MNKNLLFCLFFISICFPGRLSSQSYQLTGNPVNTTGWTVVPSAAVNGDFVMLTDDLTNKSGSIKLNDPINLKYCDKWRIEFDFRLDGNGTSAGRGDGFAFWYLQNPPLVSQQGSGLGIPQNAIGLMIGFDLYNNTTAGQMNKVHLAYGLVPNTTDTNNIEYFNVVGSSFHSADLTSTQPFVGSTYKHVEVTGQVDPATPANWIITLKIEGNTIISQSFAPQGAAATMTTGYFGFSGSTGSASVRSSIKNVKIYTDKVSILQNSIPVSMCPNPATNSGTVDLTSYNSQFVSNPANYTFSYFTPTGTPIANPTNYQFNTNTTVNVVIKDNSGLLCDNPDGKIVLTLSPLNADDATIKACNNNNVGTATFNLNSAAVTNVVGAVKKYYKTIADLTAGTNEISNPNAYVSAPGKVYVKVTTPQGCTDNAEITLSFYDPIVVKEDTLKSCFIENNITSASFDLTAANVTSHPGATRKYYTTINNAINGTNEIMNPNSYISTNGAVYVKVIDENSCYMIAKINLVVLPPVKSSILKDKIICIDARTNLDAGPGFDSYEWSTGDTTSSIQGVTVGIYWVKLKTGSCTTLQTVKVLPATAPVISSIDITNNTITINTTGGTPPYKYSLDGTNWQESNTFTSLPRGEVKVYVKDFYNCEPIHIQVTVPNLINAITPNGDNINDFIDYSALAYKKNLIFTIYDRYGNKLYEANKTRNFTWDGTASGKKILTGTYWYTISWNENDKNNTQTKYSGWILVKNKE
ncbi:T9SS type B sorting domain-containing protein [Chryseobacterium oryctis]|uniref:Gliding motility-associated C-terminal domain-containing protein n=1 Tax=Chryseobacterium oryctis TaxID=2952618 RepID=A0ABT3HL85_9FLAO|nr:T9SS type B sorting domain-containing protein [Chryseobacterium oryctis]MCW3160435.1 gliding motility-associated C-terminal domain-containing protein [Chryseobacterium oryctis]